MNIEKQLETAVKTNHLVLVVFYADWSPHYAHRLLFYFLQHSLLSILQFSFRKSEAHNVETVPAFLLLHKRHELWRQVGELTVGELKEVLDDFQ